MGLQKLLEKFNDLDLEIDKLNESKVIELKFGLILIFALWSSPSIIFTPNLIDFLNQVKYKGKIIIQDIEKIDEDIFMNLIKKPCHGWGEIFIIENGIIQDFFFDSRSFEEFKLYIAIDLKLKTGSYF